MADLEARVTATNHGLVGAVIAISLQKYPAVAIAVAPFSHFLLDALPHSGGFESLRSKAFFRYLFADAILAVVSTLYIAYLYHHIWWLVILCAFLAASPDLMWLWYEYLHPTPREKRGRLAKFHSWIQWSQTKAGFLFEALWFVCVFSGLILASTR